MFLNMQYIITYYMYNVVEDNSRAYPSCLMESYAHGLITPQLPFSSSPDNHYSTLWFYGFNYFICHISGIMQCMSFCNWIISLDIYLQGLSTFLHSAEFPSF